MSLQTRRCVNRRYRWRVAPSFRELPVPSHYFPVAYRSEAHLPGGPAPTFHTCRVTLLTLCEVLECVQPHSSRDGHAYRQETEAQQMCHHPLAHPDDVDPSQHRHALAVQKAARPGRSGDYPDHRVILPLPLDPEVRARLRDVVPPCSARNATQNV